MEPGLGPQPVSGPHPRLARGSDNQWRAALAKLYFSYSTMNAGKSTLLLQASYNYRERGMRTVLFIASLDDRAGVGKIASRIGVAHRA